MCSKIFTGTFQSTKNKHASSSRTKKRKHFRRTAREKSFESIYRRRILGCRGRGKTRDAGKTCPRVVAHGSIWGGGTNDPRNAPSGGFKGKYRRCLLYPPKPILKGESWPPVSIPYTVLKRVYTPLIFISSPLPFVFFFLVYRPRQPLFISSHRECHRDCRFYPLSFVRIFNN